MILMIKTTEKKKRVTNLNTITCIVQETPHSPVHFLAHQTISNVCVVIYRYRVCVVIYRYRMCAL